MKRLATQPLFALFLFFRALASGAQEPKALPLPDERYKADILLVVAHPDDEGAATPYLARALDEHKRIAVAGKLGSRRLARATCAPRSFDPPGSHPNVFAGNIYWRRPRGPSSFRRAGDGSIRFGGRSRLVPRATGGPGQTPRTFS